MSHGKRAAALFLVALMLVTTGVGTSLATGGQDAPEPNQLERTDKKDKPFVRNGDMISATGKDDLLLRFRQRVKKVKMTSVQLDTRVKPKNVTHSRYCEKIAIANSFNVIVFDVWTRDIEIIEDERFGLIADVEYDMQCNLIIADMGRESVGRSPRDGHLWMLLADGGGITEIGRRQNWVNPAYLDMDEWGTLFIVDKEAGPPMPNAGDWHFDAIYKSGGPNYQYAKAKYKRSGLNVSAFAVHPDGRMFVGNQSEILVIDGSAKAKTYCAAGTFERVNGIDIDPELQISVMDGFDVFGKTTLYDLGPQCALDRLKANSKMQGAQGLAIGLPAR